MSYLKDTNKLLVLQKILLLASVVLSFTFAYGSSYSDIQIGEINKSLAYFNIFINMSLYYEIYRINKKGLFSTGIGFIVLVLVVLAGMFTKSYITIIPAILIYLNEKECYKDLWRQKNWGKWNVIDVIMMFLVVIVTTIYFILSRTI